MQRLFSTFADGWPGSGLLIQRLLLSTILLHEAFLQPGATVSLAPIALQLIASVLLIIGLGTPYVGVLVAASQIWLYLSGAADMWTAIIVFGLSFTLAMIGPGAWSMDARLFGREHVELVKK